MWPRGVWRGGHTFIDARSVEKGIELIARNWLGAWQLHRGGELLPPSRVRGLGVHGSTGGGFEQEATVAEIVWHAIRGGAHLCGDVVEEEELLGHLETA